jgi:hypothetical protein
MGSWNILQKELICENIFRLRIGAKGVDEQIEFHIMSPDGTTIESINLRPGSATMGQRDIFFEAAGATVTDAIVDRRMTELFTDTGECVTFVHNLLPPAVIVRCLNNRDIRFTAMIDELSPVHHYNG